MQAVNPPPSNWHWKVLPASLLAKLKLAAPVLTRMEGPLRMAVSGGVGSLKAAVTAEAAFIVTVHVPVPEHPAPVHPPKMEPLAGAGVRVTKVPAEYCSEQSVPQSIPPGDEVTVPLPVPDLLTDSVKLLGTVVFRKIATRPAESANSVTAAAKSGLPSPLKSALARDRALLAPTEKCVAGPNDPVPVLRDRTHP